MLTEPLRQESVPEGVLQLAQTGARVTGTFEGVDVEGTLATTYDLVLEGGVSDRSFTISGRYVPPVTDAGVARYSGSFTAMFQADGGPCAAAGPFTAMKR